VKPDGNVHMVLLQAHHVEWAVRTSLSVPRPSASFGSDDACPERTGRPSYLQAAWFVTQGKGV